MTNFGAVVAVLSGVSSPKIALLSMDLSRKRIRFVAFGGKFHSILALNYEKLIDPMPLFLGISCFAFF